MLFVVYFAHVSKDSYTQKEAISRCGYTDNDNGEMKNDRVE